MRKLPFFIAILFSTASVFANTYEGSTVRHSFVRKGKVLEGEFKETVTLTSKISRVETEVRYVNEWVYDCEEDEIADNASGNWKGFYEARREDKAERLSSAIRGLSLRTSRDLVQEGVFDTKPRTWREFARRIEEADSKFGTGFSYAVLVTFKRENMINLGFLIEGRCSMRMAQVRRRVPIRKPVKDVTRTFTIIVKGGALLAGEEENFSLSFDGFEAFLNRDGSAFNEFTISRATESGDTTTWELAGRRKTVRPNNSLAVSAAVVDGKLRLNVYDHAFDPSMPGTRYVVGTVERIRGGWRGNGFVSNFEAPLSGAGPGTDLVDLGIAVEAGSKVEVRYELKVASSPFYSPEPSVTRTTRNR